MRLPQVGVRVPRAFHADTDKCVLVMEWIDGNTVKQTIDQSNGWATQGDLSHASSKTVLRRDQNHPGVKGRSKDARTGVRAGGDDP